MSAVCRRTIWAAFSKKDTFLCPKIIVFVRSFASSGVCKNDSENSFAVSYLINSCGFSSKDALSASKKVRIKSPENADAVLELLRKYGFTNSHIPKLVARVPWILGANSKETLLPKLEFFCSIGIPPPVLVVKLFAYPEILYRSLKNYHIPLCNFLKSIVHSDERVARVFLRAPRAFAGGWPMDITANIAILRGGGLPESTIVSLLTHAPSLLILSRKKFAELVERAAEMGFDRRKAAFVQALQVFGEMSESNLKHKMEVYRRCGWSQSDINTAFSIVPICMKISEKKIMANMDFLVNKLGLTPAAVAQNPAVMGYSLEKRMKPRYSVAKMLDEKGLKKMPGAVSLLLIGEELFLKKYIVPYQSDIPKLLDIYQRRLNVLEMGLSHQEIEKDLNFKHIDDDS